MELFYDVVLSGGEFKDHVSVCHSEPEDSYAVIHPELRKKYGIENWANTFEYDPTLYAKFMRKQSWLDSIHGTSLKEHNSDFFNEDIYPKQAIDEYKTKRFFSLNYFLFTIHLLTILLIVLYSIFLSCYHLVIIPKILIWKTKN